MNKLKMIRTELKPSS